jgi:transcriptional regulator with AAA-type ATPase domain
LRDSRGAGPATALALHPFLFVVLEADRPLAGGARYALGEVDEVIIARGRDRSVTRDDSHGERRLVLRLPGRSLSSIHVRLRRGPEGWAVEDAQSTNGTFVNGERVERAVLGPDDVLEVGHSFLILRTYPLPVTRACGDLDSPQLEGQPLGFRTLAPPLGDRVDELARIADSTVSVVLSGETGTGKEVLARGIHELSCRAGAFVAVNCGALTKGLAESQLFGHVRGAFSGAVADAPGFVRAADGGTLLLDEIGDLEPAAQVALLRVLQEREVVPVGSARPLKVDIRLIATSPRRLDEMVGRGDFRSDLLARLSGFTFETAPLRERREDVGLLVAALFSKMGVTTAERPAFAPEVALQVLRYGWPHNVRELEQALLRSWVLAEEGLIGAGFFRADRVGSGSDSVLSAPPSGLLTLEEQELRKRIEAELKATGGNVAQVARKMGKARMQLHRWMRRFAIDPASYRR